MPMDSPFPECLAMKSLSQATILVIDADPLNRTAIAAMLHARSYEVLCAGDREAALKAGRDQVLDLIICDTNLRGEDGIALVEELRQLPERSDVPVMFISAAQLPDVILRTHRHGSSFHLRKPFDAVVLLELVEKALWMPHLVKSHINRPHIPLSAFANPANALPASGTAFIS
jgi:CheY-like chemotaxis protein